MAVYVVGDFLRETRLRKGYTQEEVSYGICTPASLSRIENGMQKPGRLIDNIILKSDLFEMPVVGFENHGGRTNIGKNKPFGKVLYGSGNDGESGYEGVIYKNVIGTYLHGPLLPKNPQVCDYLISKALERKYGEKIILEPLEDKEEMEANGYIVNRFL